MKILIVADTKTRAENYARRAGIPFPQWNHVTSGAGFQGTTDYPIVFTTGWRNLRNADEVHYDAQTRSSKIVYDLDEGYNHDVHDIFTYDTEFIERGPKYPITFVSIGVVNVRSGDEYYAVNGDLTKAEQKLLKTLPFHKEHIWPTLPRTSRGGFLDTAHPDVKPCAVIAEELTEFMLGGYRRTGIAPWVWAWYGSYDHVIRSQLYGSMINLPEGMPMYSHDLRTELDFMEMPPDHRTYLPQQEEGTLHNALADARWDEEVLRFLMESPRSRLYMERPMPRLYDPPARIAHVRSRI